MLLKTVLLLVLSVMLPAALSLCALNNMLPLVGRVAPSRCLVACLLPLAMAYRGLRKDSLSFSGAAVAIPLGQLMVLANYGFMAQLMTFYVLGSRLTRFRAERKRTIEEDHTGGGR